MVSMTNDDHRKLAARLKTCRAKMVLSGYPSALYDALYKDWRCVEFNIANHAAGGKANGRGRGCLWLSFGLQRAFARFAPCRLLEGCGQAVTWWASVD